MNILPLVLLLILILSALNLKQIENFKNSSIIKKEYQELIQSKEIEGVNRQQLILYDGSGYYKTRKLNFRPFFDSSKRLPDRKEEFELLKTVFKNLIKVLYQEAEFYKKIEQKRPEFINEIIERIIQQSDKEGKILKGRIENLSQIKLFDPELQEVFYHMLQGTVKRDQVESYRQISARHREKTYPSLLLFLSDRALVQANKPELIPVDLAPFELLVAIYGSKEIALQIDQKRKELAESTLKSSEQKAQLKVLLDEFESEFDKILDY